ncbi:MAG: DUF2062 domain-containing protein [Rhodospirillaceae bacterium]
MFLRREKLSFLSKTWGALWPRMGWRRALSYYWHRLHRIPGTPSFIATGFACGAALAMTPFYGTHMFLGAALAWVLGGSMLAAVIGAHVANPCTAPALWYGAYYMGEVILEGRIEGRAPNFIRVFKDLTESVLNFDGALFMQGVWPVLWPMTVGSIPMAIVAWIAAYFILKSVVGVMHARRAARIGEAADAAKDSG